MMADRSVSCEDPIELFANLVSGAKARFVESVDCAVVLGINAKNSDENVKGFVLLPHDIGKPVKVGVFATGEEAKAAEAAGASFVGCEDLVSKVVESKGKLCDCYIAVPAVVPVIAGKLARILGPRGLMPNPKMGTITSNISDFLSSVGKRLSFRNDKAGVIHGKIGTVSLTPQQLSDNLAGLLGELEQLKPNGVKGKVVKGVFLSSTMGPSYRLIGF